MAIVVTSFIFSCTSKEELTEPSPPSFYKKTIKVKDDQGSSATVDVYSIEEDLVNNFYATSLKLITTKKNSKEVNKDASSTSETKGKFDEDYFKNRIFIDIVEFDMLPEVTGFRVEIVQDIVERSTFYYSYGSAGVRGCHVQTGQTTGSCYIHWDLEKLTNGGSWWYTNLATWDLSNYQHGDYTNCTQYYKYRLELDLRFSGGCSIYTDWDWYWWIGC